MAKTTLDLVKEELAPFLTTEAPVDAKAAEEERLTMVALRETIEDVISDKFEGRYLVAADVQALQTAVRAKLRKKYPRAAVTLTPTRGGGFSIEVDGL